MTSELVHALTLGDLVREHARSRPRQLATIDGDVRLDYQTLDTRVNQLADQLAGVGVESGARICWVGQNSFRVLETLLAAAKLGALFCPANWRQSPEELAFVIDDLDPRVVIWQDEEVGRSIDEARRQVNSSPRWGMIKYAAENIYPAEVERCLVPHPAVAECAVIGVPDPQWVQSVKAIVALRDSQTVTEHELIEHCRAQIAPYKKPRSVEFVEALPRHGLVVDYDALDARFGGGNYPGGRTRSA